MGGAARISRSNSVAGGAGTRTFRGVASASEWVQIAQAVSGTAGSFRLSVAPLWIRQMADIRY